MRATFNVMFFVQKGKCKADGTAPILARLTVNQEKIHFSTKQSIDPQRWDTKRYRTLGVTKAEKNINGMLDELQASIQRHFFDLQASGGVITASKIKMLLFSTDEKVNMSIGYSLSIMRNLLSRRIMDTRASFVTRSARTGSWHLSIKNTRPLTFL